MHFPVFVLALFAAIASIQAYPTGTACDFPPNFHGVDPQNSPLPYDIIIEKPNLSGGQTTKVTLRGKSGVEFRGYVIQAKTDEKRVGEFSVEDNSSRLIACGPGKENAATQADAADKKEVSVLWKAPENFKGKVYFDVTIVKRFEIYWVGQKSAPVTIS